MKITTQSPSIHTAHPSPAAETSRREAVNNHHSAFAAPTATPALPRGRKTSPPAWLKEAMFRDDTAVRTEGELARAGGRRSSLPWADDQSGANRAMDAFRASLYRHLAHRWTNDRSAAVDQIGTVSYAQVRRQELETIPGVGYLAKQYGLQHRWTNDRSAAVDQIGTVSYAQVRRQELETIPGVGYLAKQYGLQTAMDNTPQQVQPGLRIANPLSAKYQRFKPNAGFHEDCLSIYRSLGHDHPSDKVLFVNSGTNAARILKKLKHSNFLAMRLGPKVVVKPLKPGLVAIEFGLKSLVGEAQKLVEKLGGRPSTYVVSQLTCMSPSKSSSRLRDDVDNAAALRELFEDGKEAISILRALPDGHALQATARCTASLLDGLEKTLSPKASTSEFKHDLLIANALNALTNVARTLPALTEDSTRFAAGYTALLEEVQLLLAAVKPYEESDFKKAAAVMLETRAGPALASLHIAPPETYLVSSGMEAVSIGVDIAKILSGTKSVSFLANQIAYPDYYETLSLASPPGQGGKDRIRMAPLNPNLPSKKDVYDTLNNWDAAKLLQWARQWLGAHKMSAKHPAVLVLDTTIEQQKPGGTSDLAMVLDDLAPDIQEGRLKIVLCKSYQKYTSLGSAKIMAGGITLIGKDDARMREAAAQLGKAEEDLGWIRNDESQLLTHFITHVHDSELRMIGQAAKNAAFIHRFCFENLPRSGRFLVRQEEGLPFVVTTAGLQQIKVAKKKEQSHDAGSLMGRQVAYRESFAFLLTSSMLIMSANSKLRIAVGQETREELVEKLYAFAWLAKSKLNKLTPVKVSQQAKHLATEAMRFVLDHADVMAWAPAALQVLQERANRGDLADAATIGECEDLLTDAAQEDVLRQKLKTALNASQPQADSLLSEQIRIVGSAFAPRLAGSALRANDVDAMRTALHRSPDGTTAPVSDAAMQARFAPNAIASLLAMAGLGLGPEEVDDDFRTELESFYRAVLASGLPGVSPSTREHILYDWSRLHAQTLDAAADPQAQHAAVHELIRHSQLSPYRETRVKMFASIPDDTFASLERPLQRQLTDVLFGPLDAVSRLEFIKGLATNHHVEKLGACLERFGEDLKQADEGASTLLFPDDLSSKVERPADQPRPIDREKSSAIRQHLLLAILPDSGKHEGFGDRMASWAPWICNDAATANRLAEIAHACEAAKGAGSQRPDAQRQTLSEHAQRLPEPYRQVMQQHLNKIAPRT